MAAMVAIEGFRIFRDQRAFNFKNVLITPKLFSISPNTLGIASATAVGAAAVAQKSAIASSATETDPNPHLQEKSAKSKKVELKDDSLRCVMYLSCWAPS